MAKIGTNASPFVKKVKQSWEKYWKHCQRHNGPRGLSPQLEWSFSANMISNWFQSETWLKLSTQYPGSVVPLAMFIGGISKAIKAPTATTLSDIDGKQEKCSVGDKRWPSPHRNPVSFFLLLFFFKYICLKLQNIFVAYTLHKNPVNTCCFTISAWRTLLPCYPWTLYHGAVPTVTALWVKLCWKVEIGEFTKMIPSCPIFLNLNYFR